jgi:hypothetical protein
VLIEPVGDLILAVGRLKDTKRLGVSDPVNRLVLELNLVGQRLPLGRPGGDLTEFGAHRGDSLAQRGGRADGC